MADSRLGPYQFVITPGAKEDMSFCRGKDSYAAAYISDFLRDLIGVPAYAERMIDTGFSDERVQDVVPVASLQAKRINAYRTKFVEILGWRLIFIVDRPTRQIGLFAVMPRDDDYERNAELWKAIEREFDELGFTRY